MARIKKKAKRTFVVICLLLVLLGGGFTAYQYLSSNEDIPNKIIKPKKEEKENPIKVYEASLIATGDGLVHSTLYKAAQNNGSYDFSPMLTMTKDKIKDYDIKYYNQETVFGGKELGYQSYPMFNTPSEFGDDMIDAGFNLVSLSSNHSMDMGKTGVINSVEYWKSKKDVLTNGMARNEEERNTFEIKKVNGITYTMLSYTYGTNGLGTSTLNSEPYLVNVFNKEQAKKDIASIRDKVDVLIVSMHWGNEYQTDASDAQRETAKFLASQGVDIILGTHSHCIQPWEMIDDTVVFYSFGNFISNQMGAEDARVRKVGVVGMFATLDIKKTVDTENDTTKLEINNIGADLNYSYRYMNQGKRDYLVIPFSKMESKYLSNYESVYTEFSNILKKYNENINIEPLPNVVPAS